MENLAEFVREQIRQHKSFLLYGMISVFVTVIDVATCRVCENWLSPVTANTVGVVTGFLIQFFLTSRHVYHKQNGKSFLVFLWTFFVGLLFANSIVYLSRTYLFHGSDSGLAFLVSKGFSIVLPFFLMYFLRKRFMPSAERGEDADASGKERR